MKANTLVCFVLLLSIGGCNSKQPTTQSTAPATATAKPANVKMEVMVLDVRESPPAIVSRELLGFPFQYPQSSTDVSSVGKRPDHPEEIYQIRCQPLHIPDVGPSLLAGTWIYGLVRDKDRNYYVHKGGIAVHACSEVGEEQALDSALVWLNGELAVRAARYRSGYLDLEKEAGKTLP